MKNILKIYLCAAMSLAVFACSKTDGTEDNASQAVDGPVVCTYTFNGEEFPVRGLYAYHFDNEWYYNFLITEHSNGVAGETKFLLRLGSDWIGLENPVGTHDDNDNYRKGLNHQYDYYFMFENTEYYFDEARELYGGTIMVEPLGGNWYNVDIDILLPNKMPFKFKYEGEFVLAGF